MKKIILITASIFSMLAAIYIGGWFYMEHKMNRAIDQFYNATGPALGFTFLGNRPKIYGFPGVPIIVYKRGIKLDNMNFSFAKIKIKGYPIAHFPIDIEVKPGFHYWEDNSKTWATLNDIDITIKTPASLPQSVSAFHLKEWQKNVGILGIKNISFTSDGVKIKAKGTVGFNENLQPICNFASKISSYDQIISFLAKAKKITPLAGAIALSTLNAMAEESEENPDVKTVTLDIKIEDQKLYAGPVKVTDIPTINWK